MQPSKTLLKKSTFDRGAPLENAISFEQDGCRIELMGSVSITIRFIGFFLIGKGDVENFVKAKPYRRHGKDPSRQGSIEWTRTESGIVSTRSGGMGRSG